jgi:hypothetical protein
MLAKNQENVDTALYKLFPTSRVDLQMIKKNRFQHIKEVDIERMLGSDL